MSMQYVEIESAPDKRHIIRTVLNGKGKKGKQAITVCGRPFGMDEALLFTQPSSHHRAARRRERRGELRVGLRREPHRGREAVRSRPREAQESRRSGSQGCEEARREEGKGTGEEEGTEVMGRADMERMCRSIAGPLQEYLRSQFDRRVGFTLFVFEFGAEGGETNLAYISNADRESMIKAGKEWLARLEAGLNTDPPGPRAVG